MRAIANRLLWLIVNNGEMNICEIVGTNVRKARQESGLSQEDVAFEAEIDRSYLSEIESGQKNVSITILAKIAKGLGVPIASMFEGYE